MAINIYLKIIEECNSPVIIMKDYYPACQH